MSTLEDSLTTLEYQSIDGLEIDDLKRTFRRLAIEHHPDRGGDSDQFDRLLSSFVYLSGVLRRQTGGRNASVLHVGDIQRAREQQMTNELNNLVNDIYDRLQSGKTAEFNKQFEEYRKMESERGFVPTEDRGYEDWLKSSTVSQGVSFQENGHYGSCTMAPPVIKEEDLHRLFEYTVMCGKGEPTELVLHPDQMAMRVASGGMSLIPSQTGGFTSDGGERPEYSDLQEAYTTQNTVWDKIPTFREKGRTFEDLLAERDVSYKTELDRDLEAIAAYEKGKQEEEAEHKRRIQAYFQGTASSVWALQGMELEEQEEQEEQKEEQKEDEFVKVIQPISLV